MHERYSNRKLYFDEQALTTKKYVIPYIQDVKDISSDSAIMEVGCGEGGNLQPFVQLGCQCVGVELETPRSQLAKDFYSSETYTNVPHIINKDIYDVAPEDTGLFDVIFLRDVIEHIPKQDKLLLHLKRFLKEDGVIFFGFPPWQMPFGGHQQMIKHKWLRKLPYFHLLPKTIYQKILRLVDEPDYTIKELMGIKATGISIERFLKYVHQTGYKIDKRTYFFINPNYEVKFGLKPMGKIPILGDIPVVRNFVTTCMYAVISKS